MQKRSVEEAPRGMEIEQNNETNRQQPTTNVSKPAKKDLLRFEKPHYDVFTQDKYADEKEFMIRKLMEERKKPKFQFLPKSSLLQEVRSFIPLLKEANKKVEEATTDVRIDTDLQLESSSQESSSEDGEKVEEVDKVEQSNDTSMPIEETHDHSTTNKVIEMNILVAKYPEPEEAPKPSAITQQP